MSFLKAFLGKPPLRFASPLVSEKDFAVGLTYVAISRVRTVDSLMIEQEFHISRFEQRDSALRNEETKGCLEERRDERIFLLPPAYAAPPGKIVDQNSRGA